MNVTEAALCGWFESLSLLLLKRVRKVFVQAPSAIYLIQKNSKDLRTVTLGWGKVRNPNTNKH